MNTEHKRPEAEDERSSKKQKTQHIVKEALTLIKDLPLSEEELDLDIDTLYKSVESMKEKQMRLRRKAIEDLQKKEEAIHKSILELATKYGMEDNYQCKTCTDYFRSDQLTSFPCHNSFKMCYKCFNKLWHYPKHEATSNGMLVATCPECKKFYHTEVPIVCAKKPKDSTFLQTRSEKQDRNQNPSRFTGDGHPLGIIPPRQILSMLQILRGNDEDSSSSDD